MKTPYQIQFEHLLTMAGNPGLRSHAKHRARELDADNSGLWRGIAAALDSEIAVRKAAALSARKQNESSIEPSTPGEST